MKDFYDKTITNAELTNKYGLRETVVWKLEEKRKGKFEENLIKKIDYRIFDTRYIYYSSDVVDRDRRKVMNNLLKPNIAFTISKQQSSSDFRHIFLSRNIQESCLISLQTKEGGYTFPLYLYDEENNKTINFNKRIVEEIKEIVGNINSEDLFHYIYAILYSNVYREKYKDFLRSDFPRIPYPKDRRTFDKLARLGNELIKYHLLEHENIDPYKISYLGEGDNIVEKPVYKDGKVYINSTQYFGNVSEIAWNFYIGGYQPAQKWLKDRKGRELSPDDIEHYSKIVIVLKETDRIMKEIGKISFE
jgi:predicted helicase